VELTMVQRVRLPLAEIQWLVSVSLTQPLGIRCVSQLVRLPILVQKPALFVSLSFQLVAVVKRMVRMQRFVSQLVKRILSVLVVPTVVLRGFVSLHRLTRAQVLPMAMPVTLLIPMGLL